MLEYSLAEWAKENGLWAALFVSMLIYVLRTTEAREKRLMNALDKLAEKYNIIDIVRKDVEEIKGFIFSRRE